MDAVRRHLFDGGHHHSSARHRGAGRHNHIQQILQRHVVHKPIGDRSQTTVQVPIDGRLIGGKDVRQLLLQIAIALQTLRGRANERIDVGRRGADGHLGAHVAQLQCATLQDETGAGAIDDVFDANGERTVAADGAATRRPADALRELAGDGDERIEELKVHAHEDDGKVDAAHHEGIEVRRVEVDQVAAEAVCREDSLAFDNLLIEHNILRKCVQVDVDRHPGSVKRRQWRQVAGGESALHVQSELLQESIDAGLDDIS